MQVSTWSKGNRALGSCTLTVAWFLLLVHLAVLTNLQAQMLLVIEGLARHDSLGAESVGDSSLRWEEIQELDDIEHNVNRQQLWDSLEWKAVSTRSAPFLHNSNSSFDFRHVFVRACQVDRRATWEGRDKSFEWLEFAVRMHRRDAKATLEIVLVDLLECLEYFWNRAVRLGD